jgi:hypothetical protein
MILSVVAGCFAVGVFANAIRAVFQREYWFLLPGSLAFLFWYWICVGAYRRATTRPTATPEASSDA